MLKAYNIDGTVYFENEKKEIFYVAKIDKVLIQDTTAAGTPVVFDDLADEEEKEELEININEYFDVKYVVTEKDTYSIKDEIKAAGGNWDGYKWVLSEPNPKFETKTIYIKK